VLAEHALPKGNPLIAVGGVEKGERGRGGQSVDVRRMTF
jgi:hypothetical protein